MKFAIFTSRQYEADEFEIFIEAATQEEADQTAFEIAQRNCECLAYSSDHEEAECTCEYCAVEVPDEIVHYDYPSNRLCTAIEKIEIDITSATRSISRRQQKIERLQSHIDLQRQLIERDETKIQRLQQERGSL